MADDQFDAAEQFQVLISAVKRHFDREEFEQALPLCGRAAQLRPDCLAVRRCRLFALLNLSRWSDALQVCEKEAAEPEAFAFERAYCLYRLNRFEEALGALKEASTDGGDAGTEGTADAPSEGAVRLEAQVRYRMGDYEACAQVYERLCEEDPSGEDVGPIANAVASHVSGGRPRRAVALLAEQETLLESSYELSFNLACALIDEDRLQEAEARLQDAKRICVVEILEAEELNESDAALLEDHEELAGIHVQRACVLQRRGCTEEAHELYSQVLRQRAGQAREVDVTVLAVACNNVVALRTEGKSLFDSLKRINMASKESLEQKLTRKQTVEIAINRCLLLLQAHKLEEARTQMQRLRETYPGHPQVAVVQAAIAYAEKKTKVCEETLQTFLDEHPGNEEVLLTLAQLHAQQGRSDRAVEALSQLPIDRRAQPRTVQAMVALRQRQREPEKAVEGLREVLDFWAGQGEADEATLASVLRIAARLAVQLKDGAFAAEVFQLYLEKIDGSDVEALCGLVRALAGTDVERAEQYAQRLRVPSYDHLDAEELETAAIPKIAMPPKKGAAVVPAANAEKEKGGSDDEAGVTGGKGEASATDLAKTETAANAKAKRVRIKKTRWPKGYDPENPGPPPDPERWLPKHERAEYKKRMRKRDKNLARGPQGSMPVDDNAFRKQGPSTAQVEVSTDSGNRGRRNQGRKKQGKK